MTYDELRSHLYDLVEEHPEEVRRIELNAEHSAIVRAQWERISNNLGRSSFDEANDRITIIGNKSYPVTLDAPETRCVGWDDEEMLKVLSAQLWTP